MIVKEVRTKKERREFFKFPLKLYKGNPYAVPQLISDEDDEFNPEVNDAYSYAESRIVSLLRRQRQNRGQNRGYT